MKIVKLEVQIPDDAELGPALVITYLLKPDQLHASFRCQRKDPAVKKLMKEACAGAVANAK